MIIIFLISPSVGDGKQKLKVRFSNINGIKIGTPVTFAGKTVGRVDKISQLVDARRNSIDSLGEVYPYVLTLRIDSKIKVYSSDEVGVATQGLLGEKYVSITPRPIHEDNVHIVTDKYLLYSESNDFIQTAINELEVLSKNVEDVMSRIANWIDRYGMTIGDSLSLLEGVLNEVKTMLQSVNEGNTLHSLDQLLTTTTHLTESISKVVDVMLDQGFPYDISGIADNTRSITDSIEAGDGTLGKLLTNGELYNKLLSIANEANLLLKNINEYGLTFQYNKKWQRKQMISK